MQIFISYGHDPYSELAVRLKKDLTAKGHNVWFDKDRLYGSKEWEISIENGIQNSEWLILLMTNHSVRRPDGVCLDEVSKARFQNKNILPVMVQMVEPPFCITRIQWLDMMKNCCDPEGNINEENYARKLEEILAIIDGRRTLGMEGEQSTLINCLKPLDNDIYFENYKKTFYGRKWLLDRYEQWVKNPNSSKAFIIVGRGGSGKTAFVASLCSERPEVVGIHLCKFNDSDRSNPKKALMSLAYHMSTQIPEYSEQLLKLTELGKLEEKNVGRLFEYLFTEPMAKIPPRKEPVVLIIDALDEAERDSRNELLDIISSGFGNTPSWLKVLLTSRPETDILSRMGRYKPLVVEDFTQNNEDIKGYLELRLGHLSLSNKVMRKIFESCQSNFLYAQQISNCILDGSIDPSDPAGIPEGLNGIYLRNFDRLFRSNTDYYKKVVRPFLEILVGSYEPMSTKLVIKILDMDEYDADDMFDTVSNMFPERNGIITPMHKSVYDWLIDRDKATRTYYTSPDKGHEKIAEYMISRLNKGKYDARTCKYLVKHLLDCGNYEKAAQYLMDPQVQDRRNRILSNDDFIKAYFNDLEELRLGDLEYWTRAFTSDYFYGMFVRMNIQFSDAGKMQYLKDYEFIQTRALVGKINPEESMSELAALAMYYYHTGNTACSIKYFTKVLETAPEDDLENISLAYDVLGLCYRRRVELAKSMQFLKKSIEMAPNRRVGASAMVNLSRVLYHMLDWENSYKWVAEGIEELQRYIDNNPDEGEKISGEQYTSEFYRIRAEISMWYGDLATCKAMYAVSDKIHDKYDMHDMFQPRYHYTRMFIGLLEHREITEDEYNSTISICITPYDRSRANLYYSIYRFAIGDVDGAASTLERSYSELPRNELSFEHAEVAAMSRILAENSDHALLTFRPRDSDEGNYDLEELANEDLRKWYDYVLGHFKGLIDGYR